MITKDNVNVHHQLDKNHCNYAMPHVCWMVNACKCTDIHHSMMCDLHLFFSIDSTGDVC